MSKSLVTTDELAASLVEPELRILDATYFLPAHGRDARAEFDDAHIPGAAFLDLATLVDPDDPRPNMLPPEAAFAGRMQLLGIGNDSRVVVYDDSPVRTAARAWWMLRHFGARRVAILDGGIGKWRAEGRPVEGGWSPVSPGFFTPAPHPERVADKAFMLGNIGNPTHQMLDARSADRFAGGRPDAHGVAGGHIPGSSNLPYARLFNDNGTYKQGEALKAEFDAAGMDLDKPLVTTCGSGVTACTLLFGAHLLGHDGAKLYDGSWSEWGADPDTPKATTGP